MDKNNENNYIFLKRTYHLLAKSIPLVKFFNVLWFNLRRVQILFTRAKFSLNFRFVEFILKMKNVNCVLEFLYRNGSKNPRELCERTGLSLATVYRKIGRIRNGESLEIRKGRGRPQKFSASQKKAIAQIALRNPLFSAADVKNRFEKSHKHSVSSRTYHRTLLRSGISKKCQRKFRIFLNSKRSKDWTSASNSIFQDSSIMYS